MSYNIEHEYASIYNEVEAFYRFRRKLYRVLYPIHIIRVFIIDFYISRRKWDKVKTLVITRRIVYKSIFTSKEKKNVFYNILYSDNRVHEFYIYINRIKPSINYNKLNILMDYFEEPLLKNNTNKIISAIIGISTILLTIVPQAFIEQFSIKYTDYQILTFWISITCLMYALVICLKLYYTYGHNRQITKFTSVLIRYATQIKSDP